MERVGNWVLWDFAKTYQVGSVPSNIFEPYLLAVPGIFTGYRDPTGINGTHVTINPNGINTQYWTEIISILCH